MNFIIKITKFFPTQVLVFLLFFITQGFTKSLPPGTGEGDVPANVLIMLDKSGSMNRSAGGFTSGVATKDPGWLAVGSLVTDGGRNVFYNSTNTGNDKRNITYDNKLKWKWKKKKPCKYNAETRVAEFYDGFFYFVNVARELCKIDQSTGEVTQIKKYGNTVDIKAGDLYDKYLILINGKWWSESIIIRDLQTGDEKTCSYTWTGHRDKLGTHIGNFWKATRHGVEVNRSGEYIIFYSHETSMSNRGFYKFNHDFSLGTAVCPEQNKDAFIKKNYTQAGAIRDIESSSIHDHQFYIAVYSQHRIDRLDFSDNTLSSADKIKIGKLGQLLASYNPTSSSEIRFRYPISIAMDSTNNRIYVADKNNDCIQVLSEVAGGLNFEKVLGCRMQHTRMTGAHAAIQAITTDGNLTDGVHFGFNYWSYSRPVEVWWSGAWWLKTCVSQKATLIAKYGASHGVTASTWWFTSGGGKYRCKDTGSSFGYSGWDATKKQAIPCDNRGCIKVKVDKDGATRTAKIVTTITPGGGTDANMFAQTALEYFKHADSPRDASLTCQVNYIIVIGDGIWGNHKLALDKIKTLKNTYGVKTITVAYGGGINSTGIANFREAAIAGGTNDVIIANDAATLKSSLSSEINRIKAEKVSFTAPSIRASIEEGGSLMQAQFKYVQNQEWRGNLKKIKLNDSGGIKKDAKGNPVIEWQADQVLPNPDARKIWSVVPGTDYTTDLNNIVTTNRDQIGNMFSKFGGTIQDYHSQTPSVPGTIGTSRCKNAKLFGPTTSVEDGINDDTEGVITFLRGYDYFDYNGNCDVKEIRKDQVTGEKAYLGDIYHSEMIVVGKPNAETNFSSDKEEAYWRALKKYDADMKSGAPALRDQIVYVGSNSGMLHAFNFKTGIEEWAFIPPYLLPKMPVLINTNLHDNQKKKGGSNAIFGVDGSAVQHDIYFKSPYDSVKKWNTILLVPYGRGGNGFSALIVTDPKNPKHLFSIYNDKVDRIVYVMKHDGEELGPFPYLSNSYSTQTSEEAKDTQERYDNDNTISAECNATKTTACYQSKTFTWENFPVNGLTKADITVEINGVTDSSFTVTNTSNTLTINFGKDVIYQANDELTPHSDSVGIFIDSSSNATGVQSPNEHYDYSQLGETWSAPRILRIPNLGPGDLDIEDDLYVAVMGAGYGAKYTGMGSAVYIINLTDLDDPGKLEKVIKIKDVPGNGITNSVPADPVVITHDNAKSYANYKGAIIYINDLEGKITKINLTDLAEPGLKLYDHYTLFDVKSTTADGRLMFHSLDSGIGKDTKNLWLFGGTGDYSNLTDTTSILTKNIMFGIKDKSFPGFGMPADVIAFNSGATKTPPTVDDLLKCSNTTGDTIGAKCPQAVKPEKMGWYIELDKFKKVTASPTLSGGMVYYPVFQPPEGADKCADGIATICAVDDECGTNNSKKLGDNPKDDDCHYVGMGILSKIVVYGGKLYANIAGETDDKKDLISKDTIGVEVDVTRSTWKENF